MALIGVELIIVTEFFCNFSKFSLLLSLTSPCFTFIQNFGHQNCLSQLYTDCKTLFFLCLLLNKKFYSLITPKAQFVRLLMHKSKVPLVFFKSPRHSYDSVSLVFYDSYGHLKLSFPFELVYFCYTTSPFVHFYPS